MDVYALCGWRVDSAIPLPELMPWPADGDGSAVAVTRGAVPDHLDDAMYRSPVLAVDGGSAALLTIDGVARFWVHGGDQVTVAPAPGAAESDIRTFLLGPVAGLLALQRRQCPLQAAAVAIDGRAVVLLGVSGEGKSTLAAALAMRGHTVLADTFSVVVSAPDGTAAILPSFPAIALWPDAAAALGMGPQPALPMRQGVARGRYVFPAPSRPVAPVAIARIIALDWTRGTQDSAFIPLHGMAAAACLSRRVYRRRIADVWRQEGMIFQTMAAIARHCPIGRLTRVHGLRHVTDTARFIEGLLAS